MNELTEEQRKLLEDCPRENIEKSLSYNSNWPMLVVWTSDGSNYCGLTTSTSGAYIPRAAVEAWLAEQDEREAQADHLRDATEKIEGPWRAINEPFISRWVVTRSGEAECNSIFLYIKSSTFSYTEPEARALAEAEAARLNAKWREEQAAKEAERVKASLETEWQRTVAGFVISRTVDCPDQEQARAFLREKGVKT
jgi:hypothetical protein